MPKCVSFIRLGPELWCGICNWFVYTCFWVDPPFDVKYYCQHRHYQGTGGRDLASQTRKIFIGGLNYKTDEESLKNYFSKFGELVDCIVMKFPDTKRYVQFINYDYDDMYICYILCEHSLGNNDWKVIGVFVVKPLLYELL